MPWGDVLARGVTQPGALRVVNLHQAKTHLSRLLDDAHSGETIRLAKAGNPLARLMPLAPHPLVIPVIPSAQIGRAHV